MSDDETLREELEKLRQGWSAAKLFAFAEQLVEMLERPAPPEHLAALLCETAPSEEGHSWCLTARPQGPCTAHRSQAARLTGRVFVGSAGTGAAPPSEALTRSRIDHWLRNRGLQFYSANSNTRVGFGQTADAIIALMDDLAEYASGGAAQPPPSAPSNDDLVAALEDALDDLIQTEACWDNHDYAKARAAFWKSLNVRVSGVPREETKP
jgi:hypothetical protein